MSGHGSSLHYRPRKKARRLDVDIVFYDEFGYSFLEQLRRTWAPRGQRPMCGG
jgi:hypothetical protein